MQDGMADIGYHFAIDLEGNIYEGRPLDRQGAHVKPNEEHENEIGIVLLADLSHDDAGLNGAKKAVEDYLTGSSDATVEMVESLVKLVRYLRQEYGIEYFGGHLEANSSEKNGERYCPGDKGMELVQQIRQTFKFHKPGK